MGEETINKNTGKRKIEQKMWGSTKDLGPSGYHIPRTATLPESPGLVPTSLGRLATVKVAVNIGVGKPGMTTGSAGTPRKLCWLCNMYKSGWNSPPRPPTSSLLDPAAYSHHCDVHHAASPHRLTTLQPGFTGFCSRRDPLLLPLIFNLLTQWPTWVSQPSTPYLPSL